MNDFEFTLPDGRKVTIEPGKIYSADPDVGIMSPYVEEFGSYDENGNEINLNADEEEAVHLEISKRLWNASFDPW